MRIISLLPSATEILCALGLADSLVAVTHECDYPAEALAKPRITRSLISSEYTSNEIDAMVREQLATESTLYKLDLDLLTACKPDIIFTQKLCDVCAVSFDNVARAVQTLSPVPQLVTLEPNSLQEIFGTIRQVGECTDTAEEAEKVVERLQSRVENVEMRVRNADWEPKVVCLEWMAPPFSAGHWIPELAARAGGRELLGAPGKDSRRVQWEEIVDADPDIIVIMCCGFGVERTRKEFPMVAGYPHWNELNAVRNRRIFLTDGNAYFSRPGPRIVESLEILAKIFHPGLFPEPFPAGSAVGV